jgi:hypothetical protein
MYDGEGNGGNWGTPGVAGTTGVAGTGGAAGTTGTAGTTGVGGTSGAGGSDNDDGGVPSFDAGAPACTQALEAPATPWTFGFQPIVDPPATFLAMVTEVAADHLTLESDVGQSFVFRWAGPSLAATFSVGDSVSGQTTAERWHIVKGTRGVAEIHLGNSSTMITTSGAIPAGGSFTLEPDCATVNFTTCGGTSNPEVHTYYRVIASLGADSVTIPLQSTATLGSLQITNVFQDQGRGGSSSVCHIDFSNVGLISVLGPP